MNELENDDEQEHTDLEHKSIKVERVIIHHYPTDISEERTHAADGHGAHEEPSLRLDPQPDMHKPSQAKQSNKATIGGQAGPITVKGILDRTYFQRAVSLGTEGDDVRGKPRRRGHFDQSGQRMTKCGGRAD